MRTIGKEKIRVLPDTVINQIAAGEVIENPASVVKELVENALDAGATSIAIEIKGGGLKLIRVIDDGCGMGRDDALLSLERHATSKIFSAEDLFTLQTMGFRGEALASIASISHLTLLTASKEGTRIEVEGGRVVSCVPFARTQGTTVEVRSLFYNVPARKHFQKSASVCSGEILRMLTALALANPKVGFELIQNGESLLVCEATDLLGRIEQVLGSSFAQSLLLVDIEQKGLSITGYIGKAQEGRRNRTGQYLFINGRSVVSSLVSFAVKDAYSTALAEGKHPIFVLDIKLQMDLVDVNVHPQKQEVRFRQESWLQDCVRRAVAGAFQAEVRDVFPKPLENIFCEPSLPATFEPTFLFKEEERMLESSEKELPLVFSHHPIGVFGCFFLLEMQAELFIVDLPAACARIAFDRITQPLETLSQGLLIPLSLELPPAEAALVLAHLPLIEEMGIAIRQMGNNAFIIDAYPSYLDPNCLSEIISEVALELQRSGAVKEKLALRLCRYPRKTAFSLSEAQEIYRTLQKASSVSIAPDGRPIMARWNQEELAALIRAKGG